MERQKQITSSDVFLHQFKRTFFIIFNLICSKNKTNNKPITHSKYKHDNRKENHRQHIHLHGKVTRKYQIPAQTVQFNKAYNKSNNFCIAFTTGQLTAQPLTCPV